MLRRMTVTITAGALALLLSIHAFAGALRGPIYETTRVNAFGTDRFNAIMFRGGEEAIVTVSGDGDTDLDLYVYDSNGNLVASDDDGTDQCIATWTPRWTGRFYIHVKNRGEVYNRYVLRTN
jgi:hypothetical protein